MNLIIPPFSGCPLYKMEMQAEKSLVKENFLRKTEGLLKLLDSAVVFF